MELRAFVPGDVEGVVSKLRKGLEEAGFIFAETDRSYIVAEAESDGFTQRLCGSTFWGRKQLSDPYPRSHSIEVQGDITLVEDSVRIRVDLCEFHGQRKHSLGGSHALDAFVELLGRMLFETQGSESSNETGGGN
jgi:hypothetical protein